MRDGERCARALYVESQGSGRTLVLLHGFAMHSGLFAPLLPALAHRHRVHAVDLPGHGYSPAVEPFDVASVVDAVDASIDVAGATVLGWSLGGQVALQWALARPDKVRKLVLVAATPSFVARDDWPYAMTAQTLAQQFCAQLNRIEARQTIFVIDMRRHWSTACSGSAGRKRGSLAPVPAPDEYDCGHRLRGEGTCAMGRGHGRTRHAS